MSNYIFTAIFVGEMTLKVNIYIHCMIYCIDLGFFHPVCTAIPLIYGDESRENYRYDHYFHSSCRYYDSIYYCVSLLIISALFPFFHAKFCWSTITFQLVMLITYSGVQKTTSENSSVFHLSNLMQFVHFH